MLNTLLTLISSVVLAVTNPQGSGDITNSATIAVSTIVAPVLITPGDGTLTNNRFEAFSWQISTPSVNISHYTLYLDGVVVSSYIPHSTAIDNIVSTTLTTPIQDGTHTWYVIAYSTGSTSAQSEVHTFYVDATIPIIILQAVDKTTMYWATNAPSTIPPFSDRQLTVTTKNPLLSGKIEALSNFKLSLVCPTCPIQTTTTNDPDGNWKHRFYNLIPNTVYTAYLTATDAAGNTNIFPEFTITYTPTSILLRLVRDPTPTRGPTLTGATPVADPLAIEPKEGRTPVLEPDYKLPPPAPPRKLPDAVPTPVIPAKAGTYLIYLSLFGLLLHLSMTAFGAGVRLKLIPNLLLILFWPFLSRGSTLEGVEKRSVLNRSGQGHGSTIPLGLLDYQIEERSVLSESEGSVLKGTISPPFTTILIYNTNTNKLIHSTLSNSYGNFSLEARSDLKRSGSSHGPVGYQANGRSVLDENGGLNPNSFFLKASFPGYEPYTSLWGSTLEGVAPATGPLGYGAEGGLNPPISIILNPKPSKTLLEELQSFSLSTRSLALAFSMLTAIISLIFTINLPASLLLLAGLDLLYTEYIAPKGVQP